MEFSIIHCKERQEEKKGAIGREAVPPCYRFLILNVFRVVVAPRSCSVVEVRGWTVCFTTVTYKPSADVEHGRKRTIASVSIEESTRGAPGYLLVKIAIRARIEQYRKVARPAVNQALWRKRERLGPIYVNTRDTSAQLPSCGRVAPRIFRGWIVRWS